MIKKSQSVDFVLKTALLAYFSVLILTYFAIYKISKHLTVRTNTLKKIMSQTVAKERERVCCCLKKVTHAMQIKAVKKRKKVLWYYLADKISYSVLISLSKKKKAIYTKNQYKKFFISNTHPPLMC